MVQIDMDFLPLTEIHPDYFKIPAIDQESLKKLSSNLQTDDEIDEITSADNNKDELSNDNLKENENDSSNKRLIIKKTIRTFLENIRFKM